MCGPFRGHFRQAVFRRYAVGPGAAPSCPDCPVGTAGRCVRNGYGCRRCRYIESGKGPFFGRGTKNAANVRAGKHRFPERPGGCPFFWAGWRCVPDYCSSGTRLNGAGGGVSMTGGMILPVLRSCLWSSGREKGEKAVGFGSVRGDRTDGDADRIVCCGKKRRSFRKRSRGYRGASCVPVGRPDDIWSPAGEQGNENGVPFQRTHPVFFVSFVSQLLIELRMPSDS